MLKTALSRSQLAVNVGVRYKSSAKSLARLNHGPFVAFNDFAPSPFSMPRGFLGPLSSPLGLDRVFDALLGSGFPRTSDVERSLERHLRGLGLPSFNVDVVEQDDKFLVTAELPGVTQSQLKVEVDEASGVLTITAEKSVGDAPPSPTTESEANLAADKAGVKEAKDSKWHRSERTYGVVQRALTLPSHADLEKITAKLDAGVLKLTIPKHSPTAHVPGVKKIAVEV